LSVRATPLNFAISEAVELLYIMRYSRIFASLGLRSSFDSWAMISFSYSASFSFIKCGCSTTDSSLYLPNCPIFLHQTVPDCLVRSLIDSFLFYHSFVFTLYHFKNSLLVFICLLYWEHYSECCSIPAVIHVNSP